MLRQQVIQGLWVHRFNNYTIDHISVGVIGWYFRYPAGHEIESGRGFEEFHSSGNPSGMTQR